MHTPPSAPASDDGLAFDLPGIAARLDRLSDAALDRLDFGVIGFDSACVVRRYNAAESAASGLPRDGVAGAELFTCVAPCMNNFMVAQRFEDALAAGDALDATIDYVLTFRMRPQPVRLRLLADSGAPMRYILVQRIAQAAAP